MIQTVDKTELYNDLMERATRIGQLAEAQAVEADANGTISQEVADLIRKEEIHRLILPKEYGFPQIDFKTYSDFVRKVSYYNLSGAWLTCFFSLHNGWVAYLPKHLRDEVVNSDGFSADIFVPMGQLEPVEGGFLLSGKWNFVSGILYSQWVALGAFHEYEGVGKKEVVAICVNVDDLTIEKNWDTMGLRGTGSNTVIADKVFVSTDQFLRLNELQASSLPPEAKEGKPYDEDYIYYNVPWYPAFFIGFAAMAVGGAERVVEEFRKSTAGRIRISGASEQQAPGGQRVMAEISMELQAAKALLNEYIANLEQDAGGKYDPAKYKAMRASIINKCSDIGYRAVVALGGNALFKGHPIEMFSRDLIAIAAHRTSLYEDAVVEYGKELFGFPVTERG